MDKINLFLVDMTNSGNTSGVDRYIRVLIEGLKRFRYIHVHWICLRHDNAIVFHKEEQFEGCTKYTIPLPQEYNAIISERFWIRKYNEQVYRLTKHLFENKQNCILHLHTLNLIDLALYIKEHIACKIITHLHCIPWKGLFNTNILKFNRLYENNYLIEKNCNNAQEFLTNNCELQSYTHADKIICVTNCAVDFLLNTMQVKKENTTVIPNGIDDCRSVNNMLRLNFESSDFNLLFVGVVSESKGVDYILKALRKVKERGYKASLTVAGTISPNQKHKIELENRDLSLNILGKITFEQLKQYYTKSDAGIIASLQEQSSYVAIEMAMFGLPIITTAVDGLDEMFTHGENALKVPIYFSPLRGLSPDIDAMANHIITLIENKEMREKLGNGARKLYETNLTLDRMVVQTVDVYNKTINI